MLVIMDSFTKMSPISPFLMRFEGTSKFGPKFQKLSPPPPPQKNPDYAPVIRFRPDFNQIDFVYVRFESMKMINHFCRE